MASRKQSNIIMPYIDEMHEVAMIAPDKAPRRHLGGVLVDTMVGALIFIVYGTLKGAGKPFIRGFYCNDDSIKYPFKEDTISTLMLIVLGTVIPLVVIVFVECLNYYHYSRSSLTRNAIDNENTFGIITCKTSFWLWRMVERMGFAALGGVTSQILTDIIKIMCGSLRPHFLAVCKPNKTLLDCSLGYVSSDICTGNPKDIEYARMSFPSGHSSFSAYSMVLIIFYLQYTLHSEKLKLVKPFLQLVALLTTVACCITRVTDFHHHPVDVVFGFLLGTLLAIFVVYCLMRLPQEEKSLAREAAGQYENANGGHRKETYDSMQILSPRDGVKNYGLDKVL